MKTKIKNFILEIALRYIVWFSKSSNYIKHAKNEFKIAWSDENDEMQSFMCKQVIELLSVLATHGDSEFSINYKLNLFQNVAKFKTIAPLTFKDDEFNEPFCLDGTRQNKRNSGVFMDKDGRFSFVDDFVCREKYYIGENNIIEVRERGAYTGGVFVICENGDIYNVRKGFIKDVQKFKPESIYIDVYSIEYPKDWWIKVCKESDLDKYLERYSIEKNFDIIQEELNYKNGQYRNDIIKKIECAGKHMYNQSFTINLK